MEEEQEEDVTLPLMLALERLSPLERAAFLLHDVFGLGFEEVAGTIQRDPATCRQLAARARTHVRDARPRFQVENNAASRLPRPFSPPRAAAIMKPLGAMLAADVSLHADGGGKRPAATEPILGFDAVMKLCSMAVPQQCFEACSCRFRQRSARFHYAGSRWRAPDDRDRNRGRKGRGNLCGAEPRQAEASALGPQHPVAPAQCAVASSG